MMERKFRDLLSVAIEVCEELKLMRSYINKIVNILKEYADNNGEITRELYSFGMEFCTQDFDYLEDYHEEISDVLEQITGRKFNYEEVLSFFEEFLDELDAVFNFISIQT